MTVHIYGPQFSNFVRSVQWVCEEKGIDYQIGFDLQDSPVEFKGEQHRAWHPYLKLPVLVHENRALAETAPICRYLDNAFDGPALQPVDAWARAECDSWCQLVSIYIDKAIVRDYLLELYFPKTDDGKPRMDVVMANLPAAKAALAVLAQQLGNKPYLMGEHFTLVDAIAGPIVCYAAGLEGKVALVDAASPLRAYVARLQARKSSAKVLQATG